MSLTPNVPLELIAATNQANAQVLINKNSLISSFMMQPRVINMTVTAPPASPVNGDAYIVASPATGLFAGHEDDFALWFAQIAEWIFITPEDGWFTKDLGTGTDQVYTLVSSNGSWGIRPGSGDVVGPGSAVNNNLTSYDGTTGKLIKDSGIASANVVTSASNIANNALLRGDGGGKAAQATGVIVGDADEISGYRADINRQTGTTYTLQASDCGKIVELANASSITLTAPNNLAVGFNCTIVQDGAGQVTVSAASGATIKNRSTHTKLAGDGAIGILYVSANSGGTAADYRFGGDTAA